MNSDSIKKEFNGKSINSSSNPQNIYPAIKFTNESFSYFLLDNIFCVFKSNYNDILYLIYTTKDKNNSIVVFNILNNQKINTIKNAHDKSISNFRYYLYKEFKRELLLTISAQNNNIKIWNINNWECLVNIININENGLMYSATILNDNSEILIITSNYNIDGSEPIKVLDFNGNTIKINNSSNDETYIIDTYHDYELNKNFIITGNRSDIKSYDYNQNKIYKKYCDEVNRAHMSIIINNNKKENLELIDSSEDGNIIIWDFHNGNLLKKINITKNMLYGICLWNNRYLFTGCGDNYIKLIDLNSGKIIKEFKNHKIYSVTIKKLIHPLYGECLISKGLFNDQITLWTIKK